jgi:acetyl-CoA acetyltransferase
VFHGSGVSIAGVAQTEFSRRSDRSETTLALEAVLAACADAGIDVSELDGVIPVYAGNSATMVIQNFDLDASFTAMVPLGGASSVASLGLAKMALEAGAASYIVMFAARNDASGDPVADRTARILPDQRARSHLERPYGWTTPAQYYSMIARRHMAHYGLTKDQLGMVSVTMREHAQLNPHAMMYGKPITLDDYRRSPMIADPYQKLDCCLQSDGASAIILTTLERQRDLPQPPVIVEAAAQGRPQSVDDLTSRKDWEDIGLSHAAPRAFGAAGITHQDIDAVMVHDCFTFEVIHQLEEAGFCPRGEGGNFVEAGEIKLGGSLPVNPHGGLMSEGHMGSMNHIVEAVVQLRRAAGERQVPDARWIALTGWGDLGNGSMALLRRDDA